MQEHAVVDGQGGHQPCQLRREGAADPVHHARLLPRREPHGFLGGDRNDALPDKAEVR